MLPIFLYLKIKNVIIKFFIKKGENWTKIRFEMKKLKFIFQMKYYFKQFKKNGSKLGGI